MVACITAITANQWVLTLLSDAAKNCRKIDSSAPATATAKETGCLAHAFPSPRKNDLDDFPGPWMQALADAAALRSDNPTEAIGSIVEKLGYEQESRMTRSLRRIRPAASHRPERAGDGAYPRRFP